MNISKLRGFSLIELLVVVAIIGILVAIAVPNFLQAQTRSKVSKAMADLKTISSALEIYRTDNNDYPPNSHPDLGDGLSSYGLLRYNLTTPVDYLHAVELLDPFIPFDRLNVDPEPPYYTYQNIHWYRGLYGGGYQPHTPAWDWLLPDQITQPEDFYGGWRACSYGPDQKYIEAYPKGQLDYDPTNGVISDGNIWFSQKDGFVEYHPGAGS